MTRRSLFALAFPLCAASLNSHMIVEVNESVVALHTRRVIDDLLVKRIQSIDGVECVMNVRRYSMMIEKGYGFGWSEVRPKVMHAVFEWGTRP